MFEASSRTAVAERPYLEPRIVWQGQAVADPVEPEALTVIIDAFRSAGAHALDKRRWFGYLHQPKHKAV